MSTKQANKHSDGVVRTTLPIEAELLATVDELVATGAHGSRSAVVNLALRRLLWDMDEAEMFRAFETAAKDPEWRAETIGLAQEAELAGWEALALSERDGEE